MSECGVYCNQTTNNSYTTPTNFSTKFLAMLKFYSNISGKNGYNMARSWVYVLVDKTWYNCNVACFRFHGKGFLLLEVEFMKTSI